LVSVDAWSPLSIAANNNHEHIVKYILANYNVPDDMRQDALNRALLRRSNNIVQLLTDPSRLPQKSLAPLLKANVDHPTSLNPPALYCCLVKGPLNFFSSASASLVKTNWATFENTLLNVFNNSQAVFQNLADTLDDPALRLFFRRLLLPEIPDVSSGAHIQQFMFVVFPIMPFLPLTEDYCRGATPLWFRFVCAPPWRWTPDQQAWMPVHTPIAHGGLFDGALVHSTNKRLLDILSKNPYPPIFVSWYLTVQLRTRTTTDGLDTTLCEVESNPTTLPDDVIFHILTFVPPSTLAISLRTCRTLRDAPKPVLERAWKNAFKSFVTISHYQLGCSDQLSIAFSRHALLG
jgi:hypothetical protein